jgi:nucleotide-binding universal stress UspA family protein
MKTERILVPIDTTKCRPEVFSRVNAFARAANAEVILLHVVNLNVLPMGRLREEVADEAHRHLDLLARQFVHPSISSLVHVRMGKPVEEILAEAKTENIDLIMLPVSIGPFERSARSFCKFLFGSTFRSLRERLVRIAPCPLLVIHAQTVFNCQECFGRQSVDLREAPQTLKASAKTTLPSAAAAGGSSASHQFAA